jgi:hypothetical protein
LDLFFKIYLFYMIFRVWRHIFFVFPGTAEGRVEGEFRVSRLAAKYGLHLWRQSSLANVYGKPN